MEGTCFESVVSPPSHTSTHTHISAKMIGQSAVRTALRQAQAPASRLFSTSASSYRNVAVLGASGGIGQPLSLLLKNDPLVTQLRLFDVRLAPGVAADIGHVNTPAVVSRDNPQYTKHTSAGILTTPALQFSTHRPPDTLQMAQRVVLRRLLRAQRSSSSQPVFHESQA